MQNNFMTSPPFIALALIFAAMFVLGVINKSHMQSTAIHTIWSWLRCAFFSLAMALILTRCSAKFDNATIAFSVGILIYFAGETLIYWLKIAAINFSEIPLFGKYSNTSSSWLAEKKFLEMKRKIERAGFVKSGSFKKNISDDLYLMLTTFDSRDGKTRINFTFAPHTGMWRAGYYFISISEDKKTFVTVSDCAPSGFVYPKNYIVKRFPLVSNPEKLFRIHMKILARAKKKIASPMPPPLEFLNSFVTEMERANRAAGCLSKPEDEEFDGKFSYDCRCRIWIDMLMLNYFPFLVK